jgi:8-amino-7-oxononanoate synthase
MGGLQLWLEQSARRRQQRGIVRTAEPRSNDPSGRHPVDLASNDYLGLARDPRLIAAAVAATHRYGTGSRASRVVTGTQPVHIELEHELCQLTGQQAALVFSSGYTANLGVLSALGGPQTLIAQDEHAHASLIDGARLSRSTVERWPHNDLEALAGLLNARRQPQAIVVVESIYSVLGDAADLSRLANLCAEHDAVLLVDEAHGLGVAGGGRGAVAAAGLVGADHVILTATLSKSLAAQGGAVLGPAILREHLINTARTFIFDTGLAPAAAGAAAEACRIIAAEPQRVAHLDQVARDIATICGITPSAGAVQSIPIGSSDRALQLAREIERNGVLVGCFRPPSVPDGISRLRLNARADLTSHEVRRAADVVATALADAGPPT